MVGSGQARPVASAVVGVEDQIHAAAAALVAPGSQVDHVHPFRTRPRPFPAEVVLGGAQGRLTCVVKAAPEADSRLDVEAAALNVLSQVGGPAPRVLAGPQSVRTDAGPYEILIMTRLPGQALPWIEVSDIVIADRTCRLLFEAVDLLHILTEPIAVAGVADGIPRRTLDQERAAVLARKSPWSGTRLFQEAVDILDAQLPRHRLPLVFSNGDYNPLNVLADDDGFTGWVDFEHACFEDPLIGFPKFLFWADDRGWKLADQTGLVERYLYRHRIAPATFAVRVVLRGLTHLHDTTPDDPPVIMIKTIEHALATLRSAR